MTRTLVFDIETVGEDFDSLDENTKDALTYWIEREADSDEEYKVKLQELKEGLGFSPLTGQVVAIGVMDSEKDKGSVYFDAQGKDSEFEEENFKLKALSEKEMLESFWEGARQYDHFVSFNGRMFDVPFLVIRSAICKVKPTKDLMSNRYLNSQKFGAKHIDLADQLSFYGAMRKKGNLHLWCRAFGIESPKTGGMKGDEVGVAFKEGKYEDIARYNIKDVVATNELYKIWQEYFLVS